MLFNKKFFGVYDFVVIYKIRGDNWCELKLNYKCKMKINMFRFGGKLKKKCKMFICLE